MRKNKVGKQWSNIFKELIGKKNQLTQNSISRKKKIFKNKDEIKNSLDKQKLKELSSSRFALQKKKKVKSSGTQNIISDRYLNLQRGIKTTRNNNDMSKYKKIFSYLNFS